MRLSRGLLAVGLALAAGGISAAVAQTPAFFRIGTGGTGGTYYPVGGMIANAISNPPQLVSTAVASNGSVANVNAIAGGGSLILFPSLLWVGYAPVTANVTNSVALWPGYLSGVAAMRRSLAGMGERLELTHRAQDRDSLVRGALRAAAWVATRPAGIYDMRSVLGLPPSPTGI